MSFIKQQTGVTLIELTVVLLVLVALAGVAIPYVGGTSSTALCNATDVTMQNVKKAIMERYYLDTLGYFPKNTKDTPALPINDYNLKYLFTQPTGWSTFNPATQTGWRGSYLQSGITLGSGQFTAGKLDSSFKNSIYVPDPDLTDNIHPLIDGDVVVLDGWGRPLIIQMDTANRAKLVSAGAGTGIGIGEAIIETPISCSSTTGCRPNDSDDRILYLNAPTPANDVNPSCNQN